MIYRYIYYASLVALLLSLASVAYLSIHDMLDGTIETRINLVDRVCNSSVIMNKIMEKVNVINPGGYSLLMFYSRICRSCDSYDALQQISLNPPSGLIPILVLHPSFGLHDLENIRTNLCLNLVSVIGPDDMLSAWKSFPSSDSKGKFGNFWIVVSDKGSVLEKISLDPSYDEIEMLKESLERLINSSSNTGVSL